jgi:hypothetical protein
MPAPAMMTRRGAAPAAGVSTAASGAAVADAWQPREARLPEDPMGATTRAGELPAAGLRAAGGGHASRAGLDVEALPQAAALAACMALGECVLLRSEEAPLHEPGLSLVADSLKTVNLKWVSHRIRAEGRRRVLTRCAAASSVWRRAER